jgi:hypothetical protein
VGPWLYGVLDARPFVLVLPLLICVLMLLFLLLRSVAA